MKKVLSLILIALMLLSFTACGNSKEQDLQNALVSADSYIAKTDKEYDFYSITSDYDYVSNKYSVTVCADVEYYKSVLQNDPDFNSKYFDAVLSVALKNADSKTEEISVIIAAMRTMVVPMFEYFELGTQVTFKYVNTDGSVVNY